MAKQIGVVRLKGTFDDINFYRTEDGYLARRKSSLGKKRIQTDEAFKRTRENMNEFKLASASCKLLWNALRPFIKGIGESKANSRMLKLMTEIRKHDLTSVRGERNVGVAMSNNAAKVVLKAYLFNQKAPINGILMKPISLNNSTGEISINGLVPKADLEAPVPATHVNLKSGWLKINFATGEAVLSESNVVNLPLDMISSNVLLTPANVPTGSGTDVFLLQIEFQQIVNGQQYAMADATYKTVGIVEVM